MIQLSNQGHFFNLCSFDGVNWSAKNFIIGSCFSWRRNCGLDVPAFIRGWSSSPLWHLVAGATTYRSCVLFWSGWLAYGLSNFDPTNRFSREFPNPVAPFCWQSDQWIRLVDVNQWFGGRKRSCSSGVAMQSSCGLLLLDVWRANDLSVIQGGANNTLRNTIPNNLRLLNGPWWMAGMRIQPLDESLWSVLLLLITCVAVCPCFCSWCFSFLPPWISHDHEPTITNTQPTGQVCN